MKLWDVLVLGLSHSGKAVASRMQPGAGVVPGRARRAFAALGGVPTGMIRYDCEDLAAVPGRRPDPRYD